MEPEYLSRRVDAQLDGRLLRYAQLLRASPHNLLSPRGLDELEDRHLPEAVVFSSRLPDGPRLLDLGSGGGLPGVVIAAARPDLKVELLDATRKKTEFLSEVNAELGLSMVIHHGRAEDLGHGPLAAGFDLVTARAVAPLDRLVPWAAPFLRPGGQLHAIKGERWGEELAAAAPMLRRAGMRVRSTPEGVASEGHGPLVVVMERTSGALVGRTKGVR